MSCKHGYKVEDNKVLYESWNEGSGQGSRLIEQADAQSFQSLKFECDCNFAFGRDKYHLFINGTPIRNVDPNTFRFVGNYVFADKDSAYFLGFYNDINNCAIKGIELRELQLIKYPWAKAGNVLIHGYDTLTITDIQDFKPIDENWGKTNTNVVYENKILPGADPQTFKVINNYSGKDKNHTYEFGAIKE